MSQIKAEQRIVFSIINIIIPLIIGLFIYILFVPTSHISEFVYLCIGRSLYIGSVPTKFITCYLADCLWAYALFFLIFVVYAQKLNDIWCVLLVCVGFEILMEHLQLTPIVDGTFDVLDMIVEVLANLFGFGITFIYYKVGKKHGQCHDCNNVK